ncbi:MAG: DUF1295 domain-containing protein [Clostridia bacterium]|nr:DUF1295 domain-containing protein [Clostridia bacterium]
MLIRSAVLLFVYFTIFYIVAQLKKNASIVDIGWGLGFVMLAVVELFFNFTTPGIFVTALVMIWGLRLASHIYKRNYDKPEDFRYANFRENWGKVYYVRSYFQLFIFQGMLMFMISLSFLYTINEKAITMIWLFIIGIIIWITGFSIESLADKQLKEFIKNKENKGKLINTGLWKYSRHPNYFGEATLWWGIFIMGIACNTPWYTIVSPVLITIMVRFVSGVPMLEKSLMKREGFEEYSRKTSIFIPWFPKK